MTPTSHDPAAVQALIDAIDKAKAAERPTYTPEHERLYHDIVYARERLRPKPELVKVLPDEMPAGFGVLCSKHNINQPVGFWGRTRHPHHAA